MVCKNNKISQELNIFLCLAPHKIHLGPVVQSVVSLTSSLRVISLTVLADSIYNFLMLTNDVVSFEQLGPGD